MFVGGDVFDPFAKIWPQLKVKRDYIWTDNWIYLLHRKWSFLFGMIGLICILSYTAIIDDAMQCFGPENSVTKDYLKSYCWVWGTYIVPEFLESDITVAPHPGIGPENEFTTREYHAQYVCYPLILLFQACSFRASKYYWKHLENERLKTLLSELTSPIILVDKMSERIRHVTDYMTTYHSTFLRRYAYNYFFCEVLNFLNVVCQFIIFDIILHNGFITYGVDVIRYLNQNPPGYPSPFNKMFPKVTKCDIRTFGPSGTAQPFEALCIMPLQNFAEKIFLFFWFWLSFLGIMTMIGLTYRLIVLASPTARYLVLRMKTRGTGCDPVLIKHFVHNVPYEKWYVTSMIQKNMSPWVFQNFFTELVEKIKEVDGKNL